MRVTPALCCGVVAPIPLFTALFNFRHSHAEFVSTPGEEQAWDGMEVLSDEERTNYPLTVSVDDLGEHFRITAQVDTQVPAERICDYLYNASDNLVCALESTPGIAANAVDILPPAERRQLLVDWNRSVPFLSRDGIGIHQRFEQQAARQPQAVALEFEGETLSYEALNRRANSVAHYLRTLGVRPDARVVLCLERSIEMIVGLLAILKAGGGYVPLDPTYPGERLAFMLKDSQPTAILAHSATQQLMGELAGGVPLVDLSADPGPWQHQSQDNPDAEHLRPEHLAYIIYTSGSTGQPKGVMVEHRNVIRLFDATDAWFHFSAQDTWSLFHSFAFDFSVWEIWGALAYDGRGVIISRLTARSPEDFYRTLCHSGVTVLNQTPSAFRQLLTVQGRSGGPSHRLRYVIFGGEALETSSLKGWFERGENGATQLVNMYGITETTVHVTYRPIHWEDTQKAGASPIGVRISDLSLYILDSQLQPVPVGVVGELYIGGAGVARGYLNRPQLTQERFIQNPFNLDSQAWLYKTGDLGRYLADGNIEYLGRNDHQVKIRGYRIELGEIEAKLRATGAVRDAVVVALDQNEGQKQLVAYVIALEGVTIQVGELREQLSRELAEYMIPSAFVQLEAFPLTPNGKLDRKALPAPDGTAYRSQGYEAPQGEVEQTLARIWSEVLKREAAGRHDNFFELGGHSLMAVSVIERMRQAGLSADVRALFTAPTLAQFAALVGVGSGEVIVPPNAIAPDCQHITPPMLPLVKLTQEQIQSIAERTPGGMSNIQDIYPLAPLQEGILFHHLMSARGDAYLLPMMLSFDSRERLETFTGALDQAIQRHDILRTAVMWEGLPEPVQVVWRSAPLEIQRVELDERHGEIEQQLRERTDPRHLRIDVRQAPLLRVIAAEDKAHGRWLLQVLAHHLAMDHTTMDVLIGEMQALLQGESLPAAQPFRNYVAQARLGVSQAEHESFFSEMLGEIDEPTAPFGLSDVQGDGSGIIEARRAVEGELAQRIRQQGRQLGVSAAALMHLAWGQVLSRLSGREQVVFGTVLFGRLQGGEGADRALGMFINTLPVRIDIGAQGVAESVRATHRRLTELLRHEHAPLALAQRCSGVVARTPLFSALFNFRHTQAESVSTPDAEKAWVGMTNLGGEERTNYPLTVSVDDLGEHFRITAQVDTQVPAERICDYLYNALEGLVRALESTPSVAANAVEILSAAERQQILVDWNATETAYPRHLCLHQLIEAQVARTPRATAVVAEGVRISYGDLNVRANQLAHHLRTLGVCPDARVAVCLERSIDLVVALLGTLKAGGAYVPVDPTYPPERLSYMLGDSQPSVVLVHGATRELVHKLQAGCAIVDLEADAMQWQGAGSGNPAIDDRVGQWTLTPEHLAYIIYTSGSTGQPKGAMNAHRGVVNRIEWMQRRYGLTEDEVVLQKTPFSFDVSVWEFFWPLFSGARLLMARPEGHKDPRYLGELIRQQGVTTLHFVPSMLQVFLEHGQLEHCDSLRRVICSGESLPAALAQRFHASLPHSALYNLYGPTEAAVDVTAWTSRADYRGSSIPIGRPIANTRIYILDSRLQPVPMGVAGEIYIGGVQVGRGYFNRPELTQERFIVDPYAPASEPDARLYKTGDLGRHLADGNIEYLGRNDHQVKIRGFRIELGEIEAKLCATGAVREAVVVALEQSEGQKQLVAYVVAEGEPIQIGELRQQLSRELAEYMIPSAFVQLDAFPLTPNGKLDRKALPAPDAAAYRSQGYEAPQGEVEQTLARIWSEVLKREAVGRHDNFFELGGHSLMAVRVIERMRQAGLSTDVRALFATPTLAQFAAAVGVGSREVRVPPNAIAADCHYITPSMLPLVKLTQEQIQSIAERTPGGMSNIQDIYPLAPLQEGILFHHLMSARGDAYLLSMMLSFDSRERLETFTGALGQVIQRHDILRTAVMWQGLPEPVQVVWRSAPLEIQSVELDEYHGEMAQQLRERTDPRHLRIDVRQAPLLRVIAAEDKPHGRWLLQVLAHHLVIDHTTMDVLIGEMRALLQGEALPAALPFRNYVAQARLGGSQAEHARFFSEMLGDIDEPTAPFGLLDVQGDGSGIVEARRAVEGELAQRIRRQGRQLGVSAAALMHLALAQVLSRLSGREQVVFGTVLFGRLQGGEGRTARWECSSTLCRFELTLEVKEWSRVFGPRTGGSRSCCRTSTPHWPWRSVAAGWPLRPHCSQRY